MQVKCVAVIVSVVLSLMAGAQATPDLEVTVSGETLAFQLDSVERTASWMLQYSADGENWSDLIFLNGGRGILGFGVQFGRKALQGKAFDAALFRAVKFAADDQVYREFLAARVRWRAADISDYSYVVRSGNGRGGYEVRYTVVNGEVTMVDILTPSPFGDIPDAVTIADWFDEVAEAFEEGAFSIDVDWNVETGYSERAYLDFDEWIADEEKGWTISEFVPLD